MFNAIYSSTFEILGQFFGFISSAASSKFSYFLNWILGRGSFEYSNLLIQTSSGDPITYIFPSVSDFIRNFLGNFSFVWDATFGNVQNFFYNLFSMFHNFPTWLGLIFAFLEIFIAIRLIILAKNVILNWL